MALVPLVGAAFVVGTEKASSDAQDAPIQPTRPAGESVMQIVAHPDDDLFFMNPDTSHSVRSGRSLTAVYLTAGESDGVNAARSGPRAVATPPPADKARYAEARQNGIRAAYAEMATGDRTSPWQRTVIPTAGGGTAELDTLRARPEVNLVWVQLREAGSISGDRPNSLHGLWDGKVRTLGSQLSSGTPVENSFSYTKDQVIETIAGLLQRFGPTHVRTLDPTPGKVAKTGKISDHQDHTYAARFAQAALMRYAESPGGPRFSVQSYLGYPVGGLPHTLDPVTAAAKLRTLKTYAWMDPANYCDDSAGCGDLKVAARPAGHGWAQSVRYTRGESTTWVQQGKNGGLYAFAVLDNKLAVWQRTAGPKGVWSGPTTLPGGGLDSGVASVRLPDGRIAVFATRTTLGKTPGDYRRDVVTAVQAAPDGRFGAWRSLGTPERDDKSSLSDISAPAVVVDKAGRMSVYLRNGGHSLSSRSQNADGSWAAWKARGGKELHGDPVAATDRSGRQYVFAGTPTSVVAWTQAKAGAALSGPTATGLPPTTLALSTSADGDGVRLWFRKPDSGEVRTVKFAGAKSSAIADLGGPSGFGPVSVSGPNNSLLAVRSGVGTPGTALAAFPSVGAGGGKKAVPAQPGRAKWKSAGSLFAGAPAGLGNGPAGGGLAAVGLDGRLYWGQSDGRGAVGPWASVG
ncbi:PIG-L family deacetylase [Streptomyces sp. NPDC051907]|uniref:PIG-L family deacetylase n=1 Tax=Streptomyces sp. NPDC051907 TaxID=3155284 RepID=UPI003424AE8C